MTMTEDEVSQKAGKTLGFDDGEPCVNQGVGQRTKFNTLGFRGVTKAPDGWYLPEDKSRVAIVLEVKSEGADITNPKCAEQVSAYVKIVARKYARVAGILWNGSAIRVWKNDEEVTASVSPTLERKDYYARLFSQAPIDKQLIYTVTKRINDSLYADFKMTDLTDRMIFTACALVAQRYNPRNGLQTQKGQGYDIVHAWLNNKLALAITADETSVHSPSGKLDILVQEFNKISPSSKTNTDALDKIIDSVCEIASLIESSQWNGEDVMAIFFNEFNRYHTKKKMGQVLTPDHITSFMYRLIDVGKDDRVLDAACGTGAFIVKAMCNMMREAGGYSSAKATDIRTGQLFGIEVDRRVFALACANMLIHKDGKTNLEQLDSRLPESFEWIRGKGITKVLMNPPFEHKNGCLEIVRNVLDAVPPGTLCAFILPDKKLEKDNGWGLLQKNTLRTIVKLPEDLFFGIGVPTSVFVFEAGIPQGVRDILGYYIEDDGLETVKNQGRHDVRNRWSAKEDYWIRAIRNAEEPTKRIIHPTKATLSYPTPEKPFEIYEEDFVKTLMDHEMFRRGIDAKAFAEALTHRLLYESGVARKGNRVLVAMEAMP